MARKPPGKAAGKTAGGKPRRPRGGTGGKPRGKHGAPRGGRLSASDDLRLVATCGLGLEELLEAELRELAARDLRRQRAAVSFTGTWKDAYRANWRLRTANRVLLELGSWDGSDGDALAAGAGEMVTTPRSWGGLRSDALLRPERSFAIRATSARSKIRDARWVGLRVKDGIVDAQRRHHGGRATVDRSDPDLMLRLWLFEDRATLLLDLSGESLDRRGYRVVPGAAPVREQIAAACVLASGWDGRGVVVDPMCGSGTLLAEAGAIALGLAPGRLREGWAFEKLPAFDRAAWEEVRREPIPALGPDVRLYGVDRAPSAIRAAEENLARAGLAGITTLEATDAFVFEPPPEALGGPGLFLVNPPYGERIDQEEDLWPRIGDLLKRRYAGYRAALLAGGEDRGKSLGLRPERRLPVKNGPLEARILVLDVY